MAFTVQTNPPTEGANAYITVAFFREYHADRGRDYSNTDTYPDATIQGWIVNATQYADVRFEYVGYRVDADQTTEWPRTAAWNIRGDQVEGIPLALKQAVAEYARRVEQAELLEDPSRDTSGQFVKSRSETVGPISERVEFSERSGFDMPAYPLADSLLIAQGLVLNGSIGGRSSGLSSGSTSRG